MTRVTLDPGTSAKLAGLQASAELCDEFGRTLGYFQPAVPSSELERIIAESPFSEEELRRRQKVRTGRPLAAILEDLQKR